MAKAVNTGFEQWVEEAVRRLAEYFNFSGWRIKLEYENKDLDSRDSNESSGTSEGYVYARTHIDSVYQTVHVTLYKQAKEDFKSGNLRQLSTGLTHELVHVFLDPFKKFARPYLSDTTSPFFADIVENQTQKLTMVFLKTMPEEIFPPRMKHGKHD